MLEEEKNEVVVPEKNYKSFTPLLYLIIIAAIAAGFHYLGVPPEMTALIVGAGLTRVKVSR